MKMRKYSDLNEMDQGVAIVREDIKKYWIHWNSIAETGYEKSLGHGLKSAIDICNDCLDIATLGEIDMKGGEGE